MKQLVVLSGKGGTGKTSITAAFAHLTASVSGGEAVLVDADVDCSNLELVLAPEVNEKHIFMGGQLPEFDPQLCTGCEMCVDACRFDALQPIQIPPVLDPYACEGCSACYYVCPEQAIQMETQVAGEWYFSQTQYGPLFHAALFPGQENSGKLVSTIKHQAREHQVKNSTAVMLVDGPPGIGCPVISAISGADLLLLVTEPSVAGQHDLKRIIDTAKHFGVTPIVCVNKWDVYPAGTEEIESLCQAEGIEIVGKIPFDLQVAQSMADGQPVTLEESSPAAQAIAMTWKRAFSALESAPQALPSTTGTVSDLITISLD